MILKSYKAGESIPANRLVKFSDENTVVLATAGTDNIVGVTDSLTVVVGGVVDVHLLGLAEVEFGGTVTRWTKITAGDEGKAIAASSGDNTIGFATLSATSGDILPALIK